MKRYLGYPGLIIALFLGSILCCFNYGSDTGNSTSDIVAKQKLQQLSGLIKTYHSKEPKKAMKYGNEALELLRLFPAQKTEMVILCQMSTASIWLGNYLDAEKFALKSLSLARQNQDQTGAANATYNLGWAQWSQGNYNEAESYCQQAMNIYAQANSTEGRANCLQLNSMIAWKLGNFSKALEYVVESDTIYSSLNHQKGIADSNVMKGNISFETGEYQKALDYFSKAQTIYEIEGEKTGIVRTLNNTGFTYDKIGNLTEALNYYKKSLKIAQQLGAMNLASGIYSGMGEVYAQMRDNVTALDYFNKALEIEQLLNDSMGIAYELIQIGITKRKLGRYLEAQQAQLRALELTKKINIKRQTKAACKELAELYTLLGNPREAFAYYKEYKRINEEIINEKIRKKMVDIQTLYEPEKKEKELTLLKKDKELQQLALRHLRNIRIFSSIITVLILWLAFILYRSYRMKTEAAEALSKEIAQHKLTGQRLRESEENFRTLAEKSVVGICIEQENTLRYTNPAYLSVFGYSAEEIHRLSPVSLVYADDRPAIEEQRKRCSSTESVSYEFRGITKSGKLLHLESYCVPIHYQDKPALLETLVDITERKKVETELLKMRKLESVGVMAGNIARDFTVLLSSITTNAETLEGTVKKTTTLFKNIKSLKAIAQKAQQLAQKLIVFSGGGAAGGKELAFSSLLKSTIATYPQLKELIKSVTLPSDLHPLYGDEEELIQVMGSLLWNAKEAKIQYKKPAVTITAANIKLTTGNTHTLKAGNYITISITDNGKGIPTDQVEKVFDPYFSTKDTFHEKGMGLGLAICYSIIKKHNGLISIKSEVGTGTTVELLLPSYPNKRCDN